jgi:PilZ domain
MEDPDHVPQSSPVQKRKHRRFSLQYPVLLEADSGDCMVQVEAMSRNISIRGVLLETFIMIPPHTPVSFILTVAHGGFGRPIRFVGVGKVVRVDPKAAEDGFAIAVECPQPITQWRLRGS